MPRRLFLLLTAWLLVGVLMVWAAGIPPVQRTQEARVLETAREMIGRPARDWMVPHLNGAVRLRKPPLAYWLSAGSMTAFGVNERAGRLPMAVLSWLSLAATFAVARRWFGTRTAWLSTTALVGSYLFFKHGLLAETDAAMAALLTIGAWAVVRAVDADRPGASSTPAPVGPGHWHADPAPRGPAWLASSVRSLISTNANPDLISLHLIAACLAGVILSKGPNAAFLLLFWAALCGLRRNWRSLGRFVTRGGLVTLLVLAVPWFAYVWRTTADEGQLGADLVNSVDGGDHRGWPWAYVPMLLRATLPWTIVWLIALWMAATRLRRSAALRELSAWGAAILVPLCVWGNKQPHYLLPLMPPTMILVGWAATIWVRRASPRDRIAGRFRGALGLGVAGIALMAVVAAWLPARLGNPSEAASAAVLAGYPNARFVFRGSELPVMSWTMRRTIPLLTDPAITAAAADTNAVVLEQQQDDESEPTPPGGFVESRRIRQADNVLHVYVPAAR